MAASPFLSSYYSPLFAGVLTPGRLDRLRRWLAAAPGEASALGCLRPECLPPDFLPPDLELNAFEEQLGGLAELAWAFLFSALRSAGGRAAPAALGRAFLSHPWVAARLALHRGPGASDPGVPTLYFAGSVAEALSALPGGARLLASAGLRPPKDVLSYCSGADAAAFARSSPYRPELPLAGKNCRRRAFVAALDAAAPLDPASVPDWLGAISFLDPRRGDPRARGPPRPGGELIFRARAIFRAAGIPPRSRAALAFQAFQRLGPLAGEILPEIAPRSGSCPGLPLFLALRFPSEAAAQKAAAAYLCGGGAAGPWSPPGLEFETLAPGAARKSTPPSVLNFMPSFDPWGIRCLLSFLPALAPPDLFAAVTAICTAFCSTLAVISFHLSHARVSAAETTPAFLCLLPPALRAPSLEAALADAARGGALADALDLSCPHFVSNKATEFFGWNILLAVCRLGPEFGGACACCPPRALARLRPARRVALAWRRKAAAAAHRRAFAPVLHAIPSLPGGLEFRRALLRFRRPSAFSGGGAAPLSFFLSAGGCAFACPPPGPSAEFPAPPSWCLPAGSLLRRGGSGLVSFLSAETLDLSPSEALASLRGHPSALAAPLLRFRGGAGGLARLRAFVALHGGALLCDDSPCSSSSSAWVTSDSLPPLFASQPHPSAAPLDE
jgi:hypothetical protein